MRNCNERLGNGHDVFTHSLQSTTCLFSYHPNGIFDINKGQIKTVPQAVKMKTLEIGSLDMGQVEFANPLCSINVCIQTLFLEPQTDATDSKF